MDRNHQLDAPDNEALSRIDQVGDHSSLSTLYRKSKNDWTGELVSEDERERRRQTKYDTISFGIRKQFHTVGFLITLPIVAMSIIIAAAFALVTDDNVGIMVIPAIFVFLFWVMGTYFGYRKVYGIFYNNALQATPYIIILLLFLGLLTPIIHSLTAGFHDQNAFVATALVAGIELLIGIIISYPLLLIWTTPKLSGNVKMTIICAPVVMLIGVNLLLLTSILTI